MGRYLSSILCVFLLLFAVSTVNASISDIVCVDDQDGALVMGPFTWGANGSEYDLRMAMTQNWGPGHMTGDVTATPDDPILRIIQDLDNDTSFAWTDYHITIGMNKDFSILETGLMMPDGWTAVITPVAYPLPLPGDTPHGTGWVGSIDYYMDTGAPVAIGDIGTFGFKVSFLGSVEFCTAQYPTPEPTTILLLGLGAMSVLRRRR